MTPALRWIALTPGPKHRLDAVIDAQFYALQELVAIRQRERNGDEPGPAAHKAAAPPMSAHVASRASRRAIDHSDAVAARPWTPERRAAHSAMMRAHWQRRRAAKGAR